MAVPRGPLEIESEWHTAQQVLGGGVASDSPPLGPLLCPLGIPLCVLLLTGCAISRPPLLPLCVLLLTGCAISRPPLLPRLCVLLLTGAKLPAF